MNIYSENNIADEDIELTYIQLRKRFIISFSLSSVLSIIYLILSIPTLMHGLQDYTIRNELEKFIIAWHSSASKLVNKPSDWMLVLQEINGKLHSVPTPIVALFQITNVIAASFVWFYAFTLKARVPVQLDSSAISSRVKIWWPVALSLVPVALFVIAMYREYQPAVLVMALIAILVASEHYSGLQAQRRSLRQQASNLALQAKRLTDAHEIIVNTSKDLRSVSQSAAETSALLQQTKDDIVQSTKELAHIRKGTERLLKDVGLHRFVEEIYEMYSKASEIYAVVRIHDIDPDWWTTWREADPWATYLARIYTRSLKYDSAKCTTLFDALRETNERKIVKANFVTDLPFPNSTDYKRRYDEPRFPLFIDLLGLAWQLVIAAEVRKQFTCQSSIVATISRPLCWMHATDSEVFFIVRRDPVTESSVYTIADRNDPDRKTSFSKELDDNIISWAQNNISTYIRRGGDAEEYIFALLRHAANEAFVLDEAPLIQRGSTGYYGTPHLQESLKRLGLEKWLTDSGTVPDEQSIREIEHDGRKKLALCVFSKLIELKLEKAQIQTDIDLDKYTVQDLDLELV
jgi:hypothetical protein